MIRFRETILTQPADHMMGVPAVCMRLRLSLVTTSVIVAWAKRRTEDAP